MLLHLGSFITFRPSTHVTLFSDGAKHGSFSVNFPRSYSRAKTDLADRCSEG